MDIARLVFVLFILAAGGWLRWAVLPVIIAYKVGKIAGRTIGRETPAR